MMSRISFENDAECNVIRVKLDPINPFIRLIFCKACLEWDVKISVYMFFAHQVAHLSIPLILILRLGFLCLSQTWHGAESRISTTGNLNAYIHMTV